MTNNRLTWQNVAAPDFGDALRGQAVAAELFGKAADTITGAIGARDGRLRTEDSNAAMARALQIQDPNEWDRIMASQGIAGLGIDPRRATNELLSLAQTRGASLDAAVDADYNRERSRVNDARADKAQAEADALKLMTQEAMGAAYGLIPGSTSKEEARTMLMQRARDEKWDAVKLQTGLTEFDKLDESFWKASDKSLEAASGLAPVVGITDHLTREQERLDRTYSNNILQRTYNASLQKFDGVPDIAASMAEEIRGKKDAAADDDDKALYEESAGKVADNYNSLLNEFNTAPESGVPLPPEVIGMVLRNSIESNGWVFSGDKLTLAMDKARQTLADLGKPENQTVLAENRVQMEKDNRRLAKARKELETAQREYALGEDRGDADLIKRSEAKFDALAKQLGISAEFAKTISPMDFLGPLDMGTSVPGGAPAAATPPPPPAAAAVDTPEGRMDAVLTQAAANPAIDPRVANARVAAANAGTGAVSLAAQAGRAIDDMLGDAIALPTRAYSYLQSGFGQGLGVVAPELGSDVVRRSDTLGQWADGLAKEGLVSDAPAAPVRAPEVSQMDLASALGENVAPTSMRGMEEPPDPVFDSAIQDPLGTFEAVAAEAGLDTRPGSRISLVQDALATGMDPGTGKPLTKEQERDYKKELARALKTIRSRYQSRGRNDPIARLMDSPEDWLK